MALFPDLEPTKRAYDFGAFPMSETSAFAGESVRFSHGSEATGYLLELSYVDIHETDLDLIRAHYREQQGGYLSFRLPVTVWAGHEDPEFLVPITDRWVYTGPIEEGDAKPGGFYDISLSLRHVGPEPGEFYT
jgi:hypothetical protein